MAHGLSGVCRIMLKVPWLYIFIYIRLDISRDFSSIMFRISLVSNVTLDYSILTGYSSNSCLNLMNDKDFILKIVNLKKKIYFCVQLARKLKRLYFS